MIPGRVTLTASLVVFGLVAAFGLGVFFGPSVRPASGVASAPSDSAAAQPGPTEATPASVEYTGSLELSPSKGPIGSNVTARGGGLEPNVDLELVWQAFEGAWKTDDTPENFKGREYRESLVPLGEVRTDGNGAYSATFEVPDGFGFAHDVRVIQDGVVKNQASFSVDMRVTVTPDSGPIGTPITIDIEGIGVSPLHSSWELTYDNRFTGWFSAVTTEGRARAVIPATGSVGPHVLKILHGSFTFPYLNMQQSPDPTRPTFTEIFTITEGDPVLPAPADQQWDPVVRGSAPGGSDGPAIWTDPLEGQPGTEAILRGRGLPPDAELAVGWQTQLGGTSYDGGLMLSGEGDQRPEADWELGSVQTDSAGAFEWEFEIPTDKGGWHEITVSEADEVRAASGLRVRPVASVITPASGPVGTVITLNISGVDDTDTGKIFMTVYDNALLGYSCSVTGQGQITIYLPAAGDPGWHFIDLYPGIYKGDDLKGVYNYRIPQLTYADDHPGEVLPAFRFAFEVTDKTE